MQTRPRVQDAQPSPLGLALREPYLSLRETFPLLVSMGATPDRPARFNEQSKQILIRRYRAFSYARAAAPTQRVNRADSSLGKAPTSFVIDGNRIEKAVTESRLLREFARSRAKFA